MSKRSRATRPNPDNNATGPWNVNGVPQSGVILDSINKTFLQDPPGPGRRIGDEIIITSIGFRYLVYIPRIAQLLEPANSDVVRIMMIIDHNCNKQPPVVTDVFDTELTGATVTSFNNLANSTRFTTLMDHTYSLNQTISEYNPEDFLYTTGTVIEHGSWFKQMDLKIDYNASTYSILSINSNNIFMLAISTAGISTIASQIRIRYTY